MKKLYKYYAFDENGYWKLPLEGRLFFASVEELRKPNDATEFYYSMEHPSSYFQMMQEIPRMFDELFSQTRILCLGKKLNPECWDRFCSNGGICYEFSFDETSIATDLTPRDVVYVDSKEYNVPNYIIERTPAGQLKVAISKSEIQSIEDAPVIYDWLTSGIPNKILWEYIANEVVFKKIKNLFRVEQEYRVVQVVSPPPQVIVTSILDDKSALALSLLGLTLEKVHTSDVSKVKNILDAEYPKIKIPIKKFPN